MWKNQFSKTVIFILSFLLVLPAIGSFDRADSVEAAPLGSQIYVLDLEHFPEPQRRADWYDIQTFVGTLQGIVNQQGPRLYIRNYKTSPALPYVTNTDTANINTYWLEKFTQPGQWLSEATITPITGVDIYDAISQLVSIFSSDIEGLIVWDPKVMATVNVATTLAGITRSPIVMSDGKLFHQLTSVNGLMVLSGCNDLPLTGPCDFTNKFSGPNSKTDAYTWAKVNYLDTGLSNPGYLSYIEDSFSSQPNSTSALNYGLSRDYVVKKGGFAFDLSVWEDEKPNDAPEQTLGNDRAVLNSILQSAYNQWGKDWPIEIIGFFPWWDKYSTFQSRGTHPEVDGEWKFTEIASQYNAHLSSIMDTLGYMNASFHSWAPIGKQLSNPPQAPAKTTLENKTYILYYMGDHDGGTIHQTFPYLWEDKHRGAVPLAWGIVPNMIRDYPDIAQYIYDTATPNDFFLSGASGAGYANPGFLPDSDNWRRWNEVMNKRTGYTMSGFVLNGNAGLLTPEMEKVYSYFANDGMIALTGEVAHPLPDIRNDNMAVSEIYGINNSDVNANASAIIGLAQAKFTDLGNSPNFLVLRSAFAMPSYIEKVHNKIRAEQPSFNFEAVDPFTFFSLIRQSKKPTTTDDAIVLSVDMPDQMVANQDYDVSVTVRNVGSSTWEPSGVNSFKLADFTGNTFIWKKPSDPTLVEASGIFSSQRIYLNPGESIPPQGTKTFEFTVTAPSTIGISNFQAQMVHEGVTWMGSLYSRPIHILPPEGDQAIITSITAPTELIEGSTGTVSITVKNVGNTTWTQSENDRLASLYENLQHKASVPNSIVWSDFGPSGGYSVSEDNQRVFLSSADAIAPGQSKTFNFSVTAPNKRGKYVFSGQMVRDGFGFFGTDFEKEINVVPAGRKGKDMELVGSTVPSYMTPNSTRTVTVSVKNTGTETWTASSLYRLASGTTVTPLNEFLFSNYKDGGYSINPTDQRVFLNDLEAIAPEQTKSFTFDITAPSTPGTYTLSLDMVQDSNEWYGWFDKPLIFTITVASGDDAEVINHSVPTTISHGATTQVTVEFLNKGSTVWSKDDQYELITTSNNQFKIVDFGAEGGNGTLPSAQKLYMSNGIQIQQGEKYQFHTYGFDIQAPDTGHSATLEMQMAKNGVPFGQKLTVNVALHNGYSTLVNVGSATSHTDSDGDHWLADQAYATGSWGYTSGTSTITATAPVSSDDYDSVLYQTGRTGSPLSYKFDVTNGTYRVTLLFAELSATESAQRIFKLQAEDADIISGFDIYKMFSGKNKGKAYSFEIPVNDGQLNLDFTGQTGSALVNGIHVMRLK